eukprot:813576-Pleurochrysis_carterae.AAC.1
MPARSNHRRIRGEIWTSSRAAPSPCLRTRRLLAVTASHLHAERPSRPPRLVSAGAARSVRAWRASHTAARQRPAAWR